MDAPARASLVVVVIAVVAALLFRWRFGPMPSWAERFLDLLERPGSPIIANLPTAGLPLCAMCLFVVAAPFVGWPWTDIVIGGAIVTGLVTTWFAVVPPGFAKPSWLRDLETPGFAEPRWGLAEQVGYELAIGTAMVLCSVVALVLLQLVK